jgi:hypothetical protein
MGPCVRRDDAYREAFADSNIKQPRQIQIHLRDLAARFARVVACSFRPLVSEGAGNAGRPMRPQPRVRGVESTKAHALVRSHRKHPAFPAQWFYGLYRALPGDRLVDTVTGEVTSANLTPAPRRQDHTTSPSAIAPFVKGAIRVHRIPLHVRDDRETPLCWSGTESKYLCVYPAVKRNF